MIQTNHLTVSERHATLFETVRRLEFNREFSAALVLLDAEPSLSPQLEAARGLLLIFTGDLGAARLALTNALVRGHRGALAGLSTLQRLAGESRHALLELTERDLEGLDDFERVSLEREIGLCYEERDEYDTARVWFERAWRDALMGPFGSVQLPGIAQALGGVLGRLGFDALAIPVLDEGLRHSRADRRVQLLYERAIHHLNTLRPDLAASDLEDLRVFVPDQPDLALLVRYGEARVQHALGDTASAKTNFELALYFASLHDSEGAREVALHAGLWLIRMDTDAELLDLVEARLERAAGFARGTFERSLLELRRGRFLSARGDHREAAVLLSEVIDLFAAIGARRETGIARLHRAEALLRSGTDWLEAADLELMGAAEIARELGGADAFGGELGALRNVCWHLEVTQGWDAGRVLLGRGAGAKRVRVTRSPLEQDSGEIRLPANAARLAAYLVTHPCSSWAHLRWGVYADCIDEPQALEAFDAARAGIEAVRGVRVVYRAERHAYSLVWEGVSLER